MGGIFFVFYNNNKTGKSNFNLSNDFLSGFNKMQNRGSESTYTIETNIDITKINKEQLKYQMSKREIAEYKNYTFLFGKHTLQINDTSLDASQPFEYPIDHYKLQYKHLQSIPKKKLLFSGEIYNYRVLKEEFEEYELQSMSDGEVILPMYHKYGIDKTLELLDGEYSFILTDNINGADLKEMNIFVVKDRFGTKPMYMVSNIVDEVYFFTTEIKCIPSYILEDSKYTLSEIPNGSYWSYQENKCVNYYSLDEFKQIRDLAPVADPTTMGLVYSNIFEKITESVIKKIPENPFGILLSGGFNSSLITSVTIKHFIETNRNINELKLFTIGASDNTDIKNAKELITFLEQKYDVVLEHHILNIDTTHVKEEILETIDNLIYTLETPDPDTIRDAIPYYYLYKYIKEHTDINILISGDGLNEIANGYSEINKYDDTLFQKKNVELVQNISQFDILRTDNLTSNYNMEIRYPYLDTKFVEYYLNLHPKIKRPQVYNTIKRTKYYIEKYLVRKAFDTEGEGYLPYDVLWRSIKWSAQCITNLEKTLTEYFDNYVSDTELKGLLVPKEEHYYMKIYNKYYKIQTKSKWKDIWGLL
jgi:asparagine synthase (glutamine-hydrolysing)